MPPRTWEGAKQLTQKLNQAKGEELEERVRAAIGPGTDGATLLASLTGGRSISDNSVIQVALNRPGNINTSEIFELAIEVLKANLNLTSR